MRRYLLAAGIVVADSVLLAAAHPGGAEPVLVPVFAVVATLIILLRSRSALAAFVAALVPAGLAAGASLVLLWAAFQAGREAVRARQMAIAAGAVVGALAAQVAFRAGDGRGIANLVSTCVVFAVLPLLAGRYVAQHERLVAALDRHNRELHRRREAIAEQERLRERLRIARDMHDSLGHRLSLVSIQAAALEVSALPAGQHEAVRQLAGSVRGAVTELHQLVGALRSTDEAQDREPGTASIGTVVEEFRAAGVPVVLHRRGTPGTLTGEAERAAFRVVEEGLTNAVKHAPGQPVTVSVEWEPDALLLSVVNPAAGDEPSASHGAGRGLAGLAERVRPASGFLDHRLADGVFRLWAVLPVGEPEEDTGEIDAPADPLLPEHASRARVVLLGVLTAAVMFVVLPLSFMIGLR